MELPKFVPSEDPDVDDRDLTIPKLKLPNFKPHINPEDIQDFNKRDQKLILAFSVASQNLDFLVEHAVQQNEHQRELERELIRVKRWRRSMLKRQAIIAAGITFAVTALASSFFGTVANKLANALVQLISP
jgi:hypothetical protein